ncbi:4-aminobutyrate--2-oxoglutarate transaminase [Thiolinea disciformis]|uniref:4-aminobutyrate--2-oxoglutarate transaminase n=1 Tax=Thiolinea disciformis TaxID=125614 RepID=UPI00035EB641|nr:4-aminobutyrate--2-oxoglutarate transaminase [Thiolinea disciformis]
MNNLEWQQRKEKAIARGQGTMAPVYVAKALNSEVWDITGKRYIDFSSGIAVVNTGHSHPKIQQAVINQVNNFSHTCLMVSPYDEAVLLAERLNAAVPIKNAKSIFVTTGAEAVENAIKIARAHTKRSGIIAFHGGFHGRTNLTMGLTGKVAPYKAGFGPFPADIYHVPFPIDYHGITAEHSLAAIDNLFHADIEPERVAAIIIEPVQGEGGFYPVPQGFLKQLRDLCDKHGIVLICDEIQTGFARTGKMFASEYHGIEPDLITMAKGLAGGFPLAAVVGKAEIMDAPNPGGLGGTYGGSPVGCAAALAVLDVIEEEKLCDKATAIGEQVVGHLNQMQKQYPQCIGQIRHLGAMIAIELVKNGDANQPNADLAKALVQEASKRGLILLSCGIRGNVIRILTPLTIQDNVLQEGLALLSQSLEALV